MSTDVSIIMPTFRRPVQLTEALRSALSQKKVSLEIIVVDDSPERSAQAVISAIADSRVRYVNNPTASCGRPSEVRNFGLPFATGRFVHFLDDDDIVPVDHYARTIEVFESNPDKGVVFGRVEPFGSNPTKLQQERAFFEGAARRASIAQRLGGKWALSTRLFFDRTLLVCGAAMVRRECIGPLGGFDPCLRIAEDIDFFARAIRRYGGCFVDRVALRYRIWDASIMHTPDLRDEEVAESYRKIRARYRERNGDLDYYVSRMITRTLFRVI